MLSLGGGESSRLDLPFRCVHAWGLVRWASCAGVWTSLDLWQPAGRHSRSGPFCDSSCKFVLEQGIIHVGGEEAGFVWVVSSSGRPRRSLKVFVR